MKKPYNGIEFIVRRLYLQFSAVSLFKNTSISQFAHAQKNLQLMYKLFD